MYHLIQARRLGKMIFPFRRITEFKLKKAKKINKYLYLAGEQKKLREMRVKVITIKVGALGTVTKSLEKGLRELEISEVIETI